MPKPEVKYSLKVFVAKKIDRKFSIFTVPVKANSIFDEKLAELQNERSSRKCTENKTKI